MYLYRTTGKLSDGVISGASKIKENNFSFHELWSGSSSSTPQTLKLTTTQKNIANFELSGEYAFNKNGFFTLA